MTKRSLVLHPANETSLPPATSDAPTMLYLHVPFCERLCPYCSFNRYPFREDIARPYFESLRKEMRMVKDLGYSVESLYVGGGTPTVLIDELCETLDLARELFPIGEVGCETNPNHLTTPYLEKLQGRVQRLSVGVQSFDDNLLRQMDRYEKYSSGAQVLEAINRAIPYVDSLNVDMIFNFPTQTEEILFSDLEKIALCGARQVTFSPLYVSAATVKQMNLTLGKVNYARERRFYEIVDGVLTGGETPLFNRTTPWTFTRNKSGISSGKSVEGAQPETDKSESIDEYQVNFEEYPAIGSGSITHLDKSVYVNVFSISDYNAAIARGEMPIMGKCPTSRRDLMRYRFLLELYKLRFDKQRFEKDFGCSIDAGLPLEMAFLRLNGAFATDDRQELTLTAKGRYLVVVMYRQFLSGMNNLRDQARAALTGSESQLLFGDGFPSEEFEVQLL